MKTRIVSLLIAAAVVPACAAEGPQENTRSSASGITACGAVLQRYDGEAVYHNFDFSDGQCSLNQCTGLSTAVVPDATGPARTTVVGYKYQCVELPSRYLATKWGVLTSGSGNAGDSRINSILASKGTGANATVFVAKNGATADKLPVAGDEIDWNNPNGGAGHAALIVRRTSVAGTAGTFEYTVLEQNVCGQGVGKFKCSLVFGGGAPTVQCDNRWTTWKVAGWVHVKDNTGADAAPTWTGSTAASSTPKASAEDTPAEEPMEAGTVPTTPEEDAATPPPPPPPPPPEDPPPATGGEDAGTEPPPADEPPMSGGAPDETTPPAGPLQGESIPPTEADVPQDEQGGWPEPGSAEAEELEQRTEEAFIARQNRKSGSEGCNNTGGGPLPGMSHAALWMVGVAAAAALRRRRSR